MYIVDYGNNKISKINLTETTPSLTDVVTGLSGPTGLAINGNDLYIVEHTRVVKNTAKYSLQDNLQLQLFLRF